MNETQHPHRPLGQRQPGPLLHFEGQEDSLKVSKWLVGHEGAAGARRYKASVPIGALSRLEFCLSFETYHDTSPGRPDVPTTETVVMPTKR